MLGLVSCLKNDKIECVPVTVEVKAPASEISALRGILSGSGITPMEDIRGFFYTITTVGTGTKPTTCSTVVIDYTAKLMDGTTVDANNNVSFQVGAFIAGWQEALPLLPAGGAMTLYLPPSLAYGSQTNGNIPGNSNLIFTINLKSVN